MKAMPNQGASDIDFTLAFHTVFGAGARKQLAQAAGVSSETAKVCLAGNWPASRRAQLRSLLLSQVERRQKALDEIRERFSAHKQGKKLKPDN